MIQMNISHISQYLESWADPLLAENYDNVGLLVGNPDNPVTKILVSLDVTEDVVEEAKSLGCNLIVSHHPLIFKGIKKLNGQNYVARSIEKALNYGIGLYAMHTNLDHISTGVNKRIADKFGLEKTQILRPIKNNLLQLSFFIPEYGKEAVLKAIHDAGAGQIGNYKDCSFSSAGMGRFTPDAGAHPTIGALGRPEELEEFRIEVTFPKQLKNKIIQALFKNHPYEEVPYFLTQLENDWQDAGSGMVGMLPEPLDWEAFKKLCKDVFGLEMLKHTAPMMQMVKKIAICGGAGSFLLGDAIAAKADVFVTSDLKYHEFFDAEGKIILMDVGHYESEQFTSELIIENLSKQFVNIAVHLSQIRTNPVFYA